MTPDEAFIQDIRANRDDDTPRLIYADWLDEHDQPDRAEFIRVQIELARLLASPSPAHEARRGELQARETELFRKNQTAWNRPLRRFGGNLVYHRGLVERISLDARQFLDHAEEIFRLAPIWHVKLLAARGVIARVADCPALDRLTSLSLNSNNLGTSGAEVLLRTPHGKNLTSLDLASNNAGTRGGRALLAFPPLRQLTFLNLHANSMGDAYVCEFAASRAISRLTNLNLATNEIRVSGLRALVESPHLTRLLFLGLMNNRFGDEGVQILAASPSLANLIALDLGRNRVTDAGARALLDSPHLGQLRFLDLSGNVISWAVGRELLQRFGLNTCKV